MDEIWKPVPVAKHVDRYEVSSFGNVRRIGGRNLVPMRTGTRRSGAQRSKVRFSTTPREDYDVAHLVLEAFVSPRPPGGVAMHADDDSGNNRLDNLKWGTVASNAADAAEKGRSGGQVITRSGAEEILRRRKAGESGAILSREFGVSQQRVCDVYKGRSVFTRGVKK